MTDSTGGGKKKWFIALGGLVVAAVAFLANLDSTVNLIGRVFGSSHDDGTAAATARPVPGPSAIAEVSGTAGSTKEATAGPTESIAAGTVARRPQTPVSTPSPRTLEGWYDLTAYEAVSFGNGHSSVNSITIGATSYPNSIRGYYQSSAADPNNRRTWLTAGKCTRLSVWVGKDAASSSTTGTGRFVVKAEDVETASADATIADSPQHIDIDITGVVRLTLFDTRGSRDANNAWGSPRVYCTAPPGNEH
jgi:hypothetical protein